MEAIMKAIQAMEKREEKRKEAMSRPRLDSTSKKNNKKPDSVSNAKRSERKVRNMIKNASIEVTGLQIYSIH